jgi:hypothetical protein
LAFSDSSGLYVWDARRASTRRITDSARELTWRADNVLALMQGGVVARWDGGRAYGSQIGWELNWVGGAGQARLAFTDGDEIYLWDRTHTSTLGQAAPDLFIQQLTTMSDGTLLFCVSARQNNTFYYQLRHWNGQTVNDIDQVGAENYLSWRVLNLRNDGNVLGGGCGYIENGY